MHHSGLYNPSSATIPHKPHQALRSLPNKASAARKKGLTKASTHEMSSLDSTLSSETPTKTRFSNSLRFLRMRPLIKAVKRVFQKTKAVPVFRRRSSYIPFAEFQAKYLFNELEEVVSSTEGDVTLSSTIYDYEFASRKVRALAKQLQHARTRLENIIEQRTDLPRNIGNEELTNARVMNSDGSDIEDVAIAGKSAGPSHPQVRSDLTIVTGIAILSLEQETQKQIDPIPDSGENKKVVEGEVFPEENGSRFEPESEPITPKLERLSAASSGSSGCDAQERASVRHSGILNGAPAGCESTKVVKDRESYSKETKNLNENEGLVTDVSGKTDKAL